MSEHDNPESGDITYWSDQCNKARRERDEARAETGRVCQSLIAAADERDHLRALLRRCLPLVEPQQAIAPPGDTLVADLKAALEE